MKLDLTRAIEVRRDALLRRLVDIQYERNDVDFSPRHVPRARRRGRGLPGLRGRERPSASSSSATRSRRSARSIPLRGKVLAQARSRRRSIPGSHYVDRAPSSCARAHRGASATSCASASTELRQAADKLPREAAPRAAHAVRPRDARADGLLQGHRELLAPPVGARSRASRRPR